jgi:citrate lyase subunit beta/citryl-CoA lyase
MLFAPGDQPRKVQKALVEIPADAVILDLEDAVAVSAKPATRAAVAAALARPRPAEAPRVYVRVNGVETPWLFGDLDGVVVAGLDGVMLPKTPGPEAVYLVDRYLTHLEGERGLPVGAVEVLPLIESARAAAALHAICAGGCARLKRIGFGATDYTVDLGATWTEGEEELLAVRSEMVLRSSLAGLEPPIDTVYPHFRDREGYEARCRRSKALGFGGRMCIHPDQVEPANRLYLPSDAEIGWAEDVVAAFEAAEAQGVGALQVRGQLVDYAFVARARQILRAAGRVTGG